MPAGVHKGRRRRGVPRARSLSVKTFTRQDFAIGRLMYPVVDVQRPGTRGECVDGPRPCPWVGCKHHLYIDVNPETGSLRLVFPTLEPWEMAESCSLDVADRGTQTLEQVGLLTNVTRERVRQIELRALHLIRGTAEELAA